MTTVGAAIRSRTPRDRTRHRLDVVVLMLVWAGTANAAEVSFTQKALLRIHRGEADTSPWAVCVRENDGAHRGPEFAVFRHCRVTSMPTKARWHDVARLSRR